MGPIFSPDAHDELWYDACKVQRNCMQEKILCAKDSQGGNEDRHVGPRVSGSLSMRIFHAASKVWSWDFSFQRRARSSVAVRLGQWVPFAWAVKDVVGNALSSKSMRLSRLSS